jgi:hypothetical protein
MFDLQADPYEALELEDVADLLPPPPPVQEDRNWETAYC